MHVSLTTEIEALIQERVASGMYANASEVVRDALRRFFNVEDSVSYKEAEFIRSVVVPRIEAVENGTEELLDFEDAMDAAEIKVFGERV